MSLGLKKNKPSFRVLWTRRAVKDLKRLSRKEAARIIKAVEESSTNPFRYFRKLSSLPLYSLRVGNYRAIALIDTSKRTVTILVVEHRKKVYKRFTN